MNLKSKGKPISAAIYQVELYQFSYRYPNCTSCADIQTVPVVRISKRPQLYVRRKFSSSSHLAAWLQFWHQVSELVTDMLFKRPLLVSSLDFLMMVMMMMILVLAVRSSFRES